MDGIILLPNRDWKGCDILFTIGDIVRLWDNYQLCNIFTAEDWIKRVAPEYQKHKVSGFRIAASLDKCYMVLATETNLFVDLTGNITQTQYCLISDMLSEEVFLIESKYLNLICSNKEKMKPRVNDLVQIIDLSEVYEIPSECSGWINKNHIELSKLNFGSRGINPQIDTTYKLLYKAPKADFPPFNEENLCLVQSMREKTETYIVSENALLGIYDTLEEICTGGNLP